MALAYTSSIALERAAAAANVPSLTNARVFCSRLQIFPPMVQCTHGGPRMHERAVQVGRGWFVPTVDEYDALSVMPQAEQRQQPKRESAHRVYSERSSRFTEEEREARKREARRRYDAKACGTKKVKPRRDQKAERPAEPFRRGALTVDTP